MPFTLPVCVQTGSRHERNKEINEAIFASFRESLKDSYRSHSYFFPTDEKRIFRDSKTENIPYGSSTLGKAGSAIFCFHQGLRLRRKVFIPISWIADEAGKKGYFRPGKGTSPYLFDNYGLRRATDIQEIFDSFKVNAAPTVTLLLDNKIYNGVEGNYYVNVIGTDKNSHENFMVDDPAFSDTKSVSIEAMLKATKIAWIW